MRLEDYPVEKLKTQIAIIISKYLDLDKYKVFFFGSRVRQDNFPRADIDLGIDGPQSIAPEIKFNIEEEIDSLPTLYQFDLVDFQTVSDKFRKEALKNVEYF